MKLLALLIALFCCLLATEANAQCRGGSCRIRDIPTAAVRVAFRPVQVIRSRRPIRTRVAARPLLRRARRVVRWGLFR